MHRGLLGRKLGMTSLFSPDGEQIPATILEVGPCIVTQIKTKAADGYDALQIGFVEKKISRVTRPKQGHFGKSGGRAFAFLQEVAVDNPSEYQLGQTLTVENFFQAGERVEVSGTSKGKGFQGVVKRWGFRGGRDTHGSMFHRAPGSIGSSAWPSRVVKGHRLPGHLGDRKVTVKNIQVVDVRPDLHLLIVRGCVPGGRAGLVKIQKIKVTGKQR